MNINTSLSAQHVAKRTGKVEFIVLHDTAGAGTVNDAKYLAHPGDGRVVSVDFCVLKTGEIYQLNHDLTGHFTYHAGRSTHFRSYLGPAVNNHSVGIEISQFADLKKAGSPPYPHEQVAAVAQLCYKLCTDHGLDRDDITTHASIITDHSRTDPRQFPFPEFWAVFLGLSTPTTGGVVIKPDAYTVKTGDTLFGLANRFQTSIEAIKALNNMNDASNLIVVGQTLKIR